MGFKSVRTFSTQSWAQQFFLAFPEFSVGNEGTNNTVEGLKEIHKKKL